MNSKHNPEPWRCGVHEFGDQYINDRNDDCIIWTEWLGYYGDQPHNPDPNYLRAVACVNACAGLNPEAIPGLFEACKAVVELALEATNQRIALPYILLKKISLLNESIERAENHENHLPPVPTDVPVPGPTGG